MKTKNKNRELACVALCLAMLAIFLSVSSAIAQQHQKPVVKSLRLYVFDCGFLKIADPGRYHLKREEMATTDMSVACFLVAHPKGSLMWDVGVIPDNQLRLDGAPVTVTYPTSVATVTKPLLPQLAAIGYLPSDITYLAFSHFHYDHVANANAFAGSTWLVPQLERDVMFADPPSPRTVPAFFSALKTSKTMIIRDDEYDVFGDKSVIIKSAPGHSPGHQVLFLRLKKTGPVLISGDLYHYPEERTLNRLPTTEFNVDQTAASRVAIEAFLKKTGAQLWIQHDFVGNAKLKKAPLYYN
ncbi:MAG TPA: N-acyl homoserine lactonase family protein [Candidatus Acidoferrales bacterium]|nr:N-acyl homoserine lactonase family protein [Candidatus Acidoferrales bacterium]